jgi:hypothetical protein
MVNIVYVKKIWYIIKDKISFKSNIERNNKKDDFRGVLNLEIIK